jgi:hypothetical protein
MYYTSYYTTVCVWRIISIAIIHIKCYLIEFPCINSVMCFIIGNIYHEFFLIK